MYVIRILLVCIEEGPLTSLALTASIFLFIIDHLPPASVALLVIGSIVGTAIGYTSWWCRGVVSATSFTLIGVINKCFTILVNVMIWDQHATSVGIFWLIVCLGGGMLYEQPPMRGAAQQQQPEKTLEMADPEEAVGLIENSPPSGGGTGTAKRRG